GLYNFRNRDYSPTLGRWLLLDPSGYKESGLSASCQSNTLRPFKSPNFFALLFPLIGFGSSSTVENCKYNPDQDLQLCLLARGTMNSPACQKLIPHIPSVS